MNNIGNDIKSAREAKKLSIEDVADKTKISPTIIKDIENGKFDLYTGDEPYVRMYIKKICQVLAIDGFELTQQYDNLTKELKKEIDDKKAEEQPTVAKQVNFSNPNYTRSSSVYEDRSHVTLIRGGILLLLVCLVVGVVWFAIVSTQDDTGDFEEPGTTHVEGDVQLDNTQDETDKQDEVIDVKPSAVIEKVADHDYKFKLTGEADSFVLKIEFNNPSWTAIYHSLTLYNGLEGFEQRTYGPLSANEIANNAEKLQKYNEENENIFITQSEEKETVEVTLNTSEFEELYIKTGYTKGQKFYINDVEIALSENEDVEGVSYLHISLDKE